MSATAMSSFWRWVAGCMAATCWVGTAFAQSGTAKDAPSAYAMQFSIELGAPASGGLYRLALPAQAFLGFQSPGFADVRVFDGAGVALPMALTTPGATQAQQQTLALVASPVVGTVGSGQDLSLRIEEAGGKRVVQLDGGAGGSGAKQVVGALLDARAGTTAPAVALQLQAQVPPAQPVRFTLSASADMQAWKPLAETVVYRAPGGADQVSNELRFAPLSLKDQFLRLTWSDTSGAQVAGVVVRSAIVVTSGAPTPAPRLTATVAVSQNGVHKLGFSLGHATGFAAPVAALNIVPQGANVLAPVRVLGRGDTSQPWRWLASAVVYRFTHEGVLQRSGPIDLNGEGVREFKVEVDPKSPGFASLPVVEVGFAPQQIAFLASGQAPYTLAVGKPTSANAFLAVQTLIPGYEPGAENRLSLAQVAPLGAAATGGGKASAFSQTPPKRDLVLWAVLLAGVLALAAMAWVLLRQTQNAPRGNGSEPGKPHVNGL